MRKLVFNSYGWLLSGSSFFGRGIWPGIRRFLRYYLGYSSCCFWPEPVFFCCGFTCCCFSGSGFFFAVVFVAAAFAGLLCRKVGCCFLCCSFFCRFFSCFSFYLHGFLAALTSASFTFVIFCSLFLGERYIIIRASDRKYEIMLSGGCNGKYSNDLFCK